jgi:hypothetical protein
VLPAFSDTMRGIVAKFAQRKSKDGKPAVKLQLSTPKHLYRCMEKMCLKGGADRYTCVNICDIDRCIIECDDCGGLSALLQALLACPAVRVIRVKDRANHITSMNWMDVMVNLVLVGDEYEHVCEIQIVHSKMFLARKGLGGHGPYGQVRAASEILEVRKKQAGHSSWHHHSTRDAKTLGAATSTSRSSVTNPMAENENPMMRAGAQAVQRAPHTLPTTSASDGSSAVGWEHTSSAQAMDEVLPEGWQKLTDPSSGNDYFANEATGETLWTKPDNTALKQVNPTRSATAAEGSAHL